MKKSKHGRLALGLSVLLHVLLLTGMAWLAPLAATTPPLVALELELISAPLTQNGPFVPSPLLQEPRAKPDNLPSESKPAITRFADSRGAAAAVSEIAVSGAAASDNGGPAAAAPAPVLGSGVSPAAAPALVTAFQPPRLLHKVEPSYPEEARRQSLEGRVVIRVEVLASGRAGEVTIQQSSGQPLLDAAAVDAVRQWRFIPAKDARGMPMLSVTTVPISFRLNN